MDFSQPPPGIGPHEGRELELMLAGKKPLAYFSDLTRSELELPDALFEPYVQTGQIIKRAFLHTEKIHGKEEEMRSLFFALPGEAWRIQKAHENRRRTYDKRRVSADDARELGELLGYTNSEIDAFLVWAERVDQALRDGELA